MQDDHASCVPVQVRSFDRLLRLRAVFHAIARRETASTSPVICWVDLVLARCGEAALALASTRSTAAPLVSTPLQTLAEHKERMSLYAALQLPGKHRTLLSRPPHSIFQGLTEQWSDIVDMIASDYASPAAIRLAIRLVFAVYVLPLDLRGLSGAPDRLWPVDGYDFRFLNLTLQASGCDLGQDEMRSSIRCERISTRQMRMM